MLSASTSATGEQRIGCLVGSTVNFVRMEMNIFRLRPCNKLAKLWQGRTPYRMGCLAALLRSLKASMMMERCHLNIVSQDPYIQDVAHVLSFTSIGLAWQHTCCSRSEGLSCLTFYYNSLKASCQRPYNPNQLNVDILSTQAATFKSRNNREGNDISNEIGTMSSNGNTGVVGIPLCTNAIDVASYLGRLNV